MTSAPFLISQWQNSVVARWTPTTHASGFVVEAKGLIVTNQRVIAHVEPTGLSSAFVLTTS